jgi:hypothetical protein
MVYVPLLSNEAMVTNMVFGLGLNDTVTVTNPTPPTNISFAGLTPPATVAVAASAPGDPHLFAANAGGGTGNRNHEGAPYDGFDTLLQASYNNMMPYTTTPNISHPSHPDYGGSTVIGGLMDEAPHGDEGADQVDYADEDFEEDEEEAAEAAKEASADKPRRGRPPGKPATKRK